jgi:hypothetical protein
VQGTRTDRRRPLWKHTHMEGVEEAAVGTDLGRPDNEARRQCVKDKPWAAPKEERATRAQEPAAVPPGSQVD